MMTEAANGFSTESPPSERRSKDRRLSTVQVLFALILSAALMMTLNFSTRIQADRELQGIHSKVMQEIAYLEDQQTALLAELEYVKSDAYVEIWARDEGKMIRQGEILILPQRSTAASAESQAVAPAAPVEFKTTPREPENWELWWALFFDVPAGGE